MLYQGGWPVFADVDRDTFLIDPDSVRDRITPRTRAIVTVALYVYFQHGRSGPLGRLGESIVEFVSGLFRSFS